MMDVLGMESGPEFGLALRRIHSGLFGQAQMPRFGKRSTQRLNDARGSTIKECLRRESRYG